MTECCAPLSFILLMCFDLRSISFHYDFGISFQYNGERSLPPFRLYSCFVPTTEKKNNCKFYGMIDFEGKK